MCFLSNAAHLAVAITCQTYADGAFSSHPSFPRICGWHLNPCVLFHYLKSLQKSSKICKPAVTSLESCFHNLPPYLPWLKCLPCNRTGVIFIQTPRSPRHPGHLYRHRRHGLSCCFPTAEDGCLAALTSSMWVTMFDPVTPNVSIENA